MVRVRFAPSPTGPLHIGGVRTALYNYLFARQHGGKMLLRIEDTDSQRFVPGAEEYIIEAFRWLGIPFDEGVSYGGDCGPYRQSERKSLYKQYVDQLLRDHRAYLAFDTPEELEARRAQTPNFQYDASTRMQMRNSLTCSEDETEALVAAGSRYVVRIKIDPGEDICVNDLIRGRVVVNSSIIDDKAIYKSSDQLPTYHLANVVDDHLMRITHVIRGEEWLPSAPLHVLLYRYLGWTDTMPAFAHLPLLLKPEGGGKLSKRDGDRLGFPVFPLAWRDPHSGEQVTGYRESGYLPAAVVNFLALLGWNPGDNQELMSLDELAQRFDLAHCSKSGARFDYEKGRWFNHQYIQRTDDAALARMFMPVLESHGVHDADPAYVEKIVALMKERVSLLPELWQCTHYFFVAPADYDEKTRAKRWKPDSAAQLAELIGVLQDCEPFDADGTEARVKDWIQQRGYHTGNIMNAVRLALAGEGIGPQVFHITQAIGKDETIRRLQRAIRILQ